MAIPGFGEIAEQLRRSTVLVHSGGRGTLRAGSGVIWSSDGEVVTNAHVVRGSRVNVQLWDGREFEAAVRSRDPRRDLAQLRIDAENLPAAIRGRFFRNCVPANSPSPLAIPWVSSARWPPE